MQARERPVSKQREGTEGETRRLKEGMNVTLMKGWVQILRARGFLVKKQKGKGIGDL